MYILYRIIGKGWSLRKLPIGRFAWARKRPIGSFREAHGNCRLLVKRLDRFAFVNFSSPGLKPIFYIISQSQVKRNLFRYKHTKCSLPSSLWGTGDWPEIINISILYIEHGRQPPHAPTKFRPWLQHQEKAHDVVTQLFGRTNVPLVAALPRINANTVFP